jgi:hypothetical protein
MPEGSFLNKFSCLQKSSRLQKSLRLGNVGFRLVGAYGLRKRELAPTRVLKNWPLEPILRLLNLQLQRQRCSRLERFFRVDENIFVFKTHYIGKPLVALYFTIVRMDSSGFVFYVKVRKNITFQLYVILRNIPFLIRVKTYYMNCLLKLFFVFLFLSVT